MFVEKNFPVLPPCIIQYWKKSTYSSIEIRMFCYIVIQSFFKGIKMILKWLRISSPLRLKLKSISDLTCISKWYIMSEAWHWFPRPSGKQALNAVNITEPDFLIFPTVKLIAAGLLHQFEKGLMNDLGNMVSYMLINGHLRCETCR